MWVFFAVGVFAVPRAKGWGKFAQENGQGIDYGEARSSKKCRCRGFPFFSVFRLLFAKFVPSFYQAFVKL